MSVLNYIWVEWSLSPRIIVVEAPYTEVTLQDLVDTLRYLEADLSAMDDEHLVDASGKEDLGGGVYVGITAELNNARLMFEARSTPISTGNTCSVDQKGTVINAAGATFLADGVSIGDTVFNETTGAMGTITALDSETRLSHFQLSGGSRNDWQIGDNVIVYENAQCSVSGGNLTSVDEDGLSLEPIFQSPNVQVVRTSSASATFSEAESLQYSSFQNAVWLDITSLNSGTAYPNGNREFPVNNLSDAKQIATERGFDTIQILKSMTIDGDVNLNSFQLVGRSHVNTEITLASTAVVNDITLVNAKVHGVLDGGTHIVDCVVASIAYVNGHIHNSGLIGKITLSGNEDAVIANCFTIDQDTPPVIDMGGSGQSLAVPNYSGLITIKNLNSASEEIGVGLNAGMVTLASDLLAGTGIIGGSGILVDYSGSQFTVNTDGLMSKDTISKAVWDEVLDEDTHNVTESAGRRLRQTSGMILFEGIAAGAGIGNNQIQLGTGASSVNGSYDPSLVVLTGGTGAGQARLIYQYDGATKTATLDRNWKVNPDNTTRVIIYGNPGREHVNEGLIQAATADTVTLNSAASNQDDAYVRQTIFVRSGTGDDQVRLIMSYDGTTKIATIDDAWETIPDSTSGYVILPSRNPSPDSIAESVWDEPIGAHLIANTTGHEMYHIAYDDMVTIDTVNGVSGIIYPTGTHENPVDNLADALTMASEHNFSEIHIIGDLTINGEDTTGITFSADRSLGNSITITSMVNSDACYFEDLTVSGALTGATRFTTCVLGALTGFHGGAKNCLLTNNIDISGGGANYFTDCDTYVANAYDYKELDIGSNLLNLIRCRGNFSIINKTGSGIISADLSAGAVQVASSCIAGIIVVAGMSELSDLSASGCTVIDGTTSEAGIANKVWENDAAGRVLGLMQENQYLDNTVYRTYGGQKFLTTGRIRLYSDEASVGTASNCTASYLISATWTNDEMDTYKVVKSG